jgi:protein gp37
MDAIIQTMTIEEARTLTEEIRKDAYGLRSKLTEMYERDGWKVLGYASMKEYMLKEFPDLSQTNLYNQLRAGRTEQNLSEFTIVNSIPESVLRPISENEYIHQPEAQREIWQEAVAQSPKGKPTAKDVQAAKENYEQKKTQPKQADYITIDSWNSGQRSNGNGTGRPTMNETNDNIEWAAWSWNPVTGCLHNCDYCYARDIAARFYEQGFAPSFIPSRLSAPANTKQSKPRWDGDTGYMNVFTCSMADLFGKWVPREWIKSVLKVVEDNPQWTFLFLTKFPVRMAEFTYPSNVWLGTTVDKQHAVDRAESAFKKIKASGFKGICWLSCEPMLERLEFTNLKMFDWVVMGGASKSTQTPEMRPPFDDVVSLYQQARKSGCKVYMKTNLGIEQRVREYPMEHVA